jgi:hypothetical protein
MKKFTFFDLIKGLLFILLSYLIFRWTLQFAVYVVLNHENLALKEWVLLIFIGLVCIVAILTVFSKINESKNEKKLVREEFRELKADVCRNKISLTYTLGSMPFLWGIGTAILIFGYYKSHHMFYVYFYFFAAGLFPLSYSMLKQIVIDENGLKLFLGSYFNRKCIILTWNQISSISYTTYETTHMASAGGRVRIPYKETKTSEGLLINLKGQLPKSSQALIIEAKDGFFVNNEIEFDAETHLIILKRPPGGGFKAFLDKIEKYADVEISREKESALDRFINVFAYSAKLIFISIALLCLYLFR